MTQRARELAKTLVGKLVEDGLIDPAKTKETAGGEQETQE